MNHYLEWPCLGLVCRIAKTRDREKVDVEESAGCEKISLLLLTGICQPKIQASDFLCKMLQIRKQC